jgi:hypothetical protein
LALAPKTIPRRKSYELKLVALWTFGGAGRNNHFKLALGIISNGTHAVKPDLS